MFRTVGDQVSLWESLLPEEVLRLPAELARVDVLLDDPAFFAPFAPHAATAAGHFPYAGRVAQRGEREPPSPPRRHHQQDRAGRPVSCPPTRPGSQ